MGMLISFILIIVLAVAALVGTIAAAKQEESRYGEKVKGNSIRLTLIYVVVLLGSAISLGIYLVL